MIQQGFGVLISGEAESIGFGLLEGSQEYRRCIHEAVYHVTSIRALCSRHRIAKILWHIYPSHLSVHSAFAFSANAFIPTFWSLLPNKLWKTLLSYSTPSLSGKS
jgi:hypothetical protein